VKDAVKGGINLAATYLAIPVYGDYFVPYEGLKHLDSWTGGFGGAALGTFLPVLWADQAFGLAGDAGLDWVKQKTGSAEPIFDEAPPGVHNQHIPGFGRHFYLPGLWKRNGRRHVDFRWS
jgi:hypothetical protein